MNKLRKILKNIEKTLFSFYRVLKNGTFVTNTSIPIALDKEVFILGNGPSLKEMLDDHLELLKTKKTFCVNNFCMSEYFTLIKPEYYILLDSAFFMIKNTSSRFLVLQENIFTALEKNVTWPMTLFIPAHTDMYKQWDSLRKKNENININFINTNLANGFEKISFFLYKNNYAMPVAQNVLIAAIFFSLNMGYKNIYLLGADHSWCQDLCVNDQNQLCILDKHFNGLEKKIFFKGHTSDEVWNMKDILMAWSKTFEGYMILEKYSRYLNKNIYNITQNSYIDAFIRVKIEDLY